MNKSVTRILLVALEIAILIHLAKDITQDILQINTPLNSMGDIKENTSSFSTPMLWFFHWAMVNTVIIEAFLAIYLLPKYIRDGITWRQIGIISAFLAYIAGCFLWTYTLQ